MFSALYQIIFLELSVALFLLFILFVAKTRNFAFALKKIHFLLIYSENKNANYFHVLYSTLKIILSVLYSQIQYFSKIFQNFPSRFLRY